MKRMKVILLFLCVSMFSFGQSSSSHSERHEKIQSMKIAYLTEKLELSSQEAEKFWPVFNEYDSRRHDLEKSIYRSNYIGLDSLQSLGDKDVSAMIANRLDKEQQLIDLRKNYYAKFEKILPLKKVYLLFEAEAGFKRMLLEYLQGEHSSRNAEKDHD